MRRLHRSRRRRRRRVSKGIRHKCRGICLCCMCPAPATLSLPVRAGQVYYPAQVPARALCVVYATCDASKCAKK